MGALNFPSTPSDGQIYEKWQWDSSENSWELIPTGVDAIQYYAGTGLSLADYVFSVDSDFITSVADEGHWDSALTISLIDADYVNSLVETQILSSTDSLPEGVTNLYYTDARVENLVDSSYISNIVNDNYFTDNNINISSPQLQIGNWKLQEVGGELVISKSGVKKAKIKDNGEIVSIDDVTAFGTV
jgi:hypothetical protein